jgi:hypothetical protein
MKHFVFKSSGLGPSEVALVEPTLKLGHFLFECTHLTERLVRKGYCSVLICEIALVEYFKSAAKEKEESNYVAVRHERLADVVDLSSRVMAFGIRHEDDVSRDQWTRRDVGGGSVWALPDGMELSFDEDARKLPDGPAIQLAAAIGGHILWNDSEAFVGWLARNWLALDEARRSVWDNRCAKLNYVRSRNNGDCEQRLTPNVGVVRRAARAAKRHSAAACPRRTTG